MRWPAIDPDHASSVAPAPGNATARMYHGIQETTPPINGVA